MINKTAVGYAYDSSKDSDKLKQQKQEIEQYCKDNRFQLQTVYMAGKSDGKSKEEIFKTFVLIESEYMSFAKESETPWPK